MASDTIRYEEICLYYEPSDDISALQSYLDDNRISYSALIYEDGTECKANLATWGYGLENEQIEITFPIVIYKDLRYEGPPAFHITFYAKSTSDFADDFVSKAEKE